MTIRRIKTNKRMSQAVVYGGQVVTAGQVAWNAKGEGVTAQTADILQAIDQLLSQAGTDKSRLINATVWLSDINEFDNMNSAWDAWLEGVEAPARSCVESTLAAPIFNVEITVTAAVD